MPKVYNIHHPPVPKDAVYIGRGSPWGNPFKIDRKHSRADVIALFINYYHQARLDRYIKDLKGKDLVCFCSPLPCHGDFLLKQANKKFCLKLAKRSIQCLS